jgi:hypothetical protein
MTLTILKERYLGVQISCVAMSHQVDKAKYKGDKCPIMTMPIYGQNLV